MQINGKRKELPLSFLAASPLSPHEYSRSTVLKKKEKYGTVGADKPRAKTSREKIWAERFLLAPMPSRLAHFAAQMKACCQVGVEFTTFFFLGGLAIAVPGEVRGQYKAWNEHGRLSWEDLVQPAIDLARNGFPISHALADALNDDMVEKIKKDKGLR